MPVDGWLRYAVGDTDLIMPVASSFTMRGIAFRSGILRSRANCIGACPGLAGEDASGTGAGGGGAFGVFGIPCIDIPDPTPEGGIGGADVGTAADGAPLGGTGGMAAGGKKLAISGIGGGTADPSGLPSFSIDLSSIVVRTAFNSVTRHSCINFT